MENEPLRIGRVTRATERTLGISLTGSVMIYIENEMLDSLAERHPDTYLTHIQEIGAILKNPDFVAFAPEEERFIYARLYFKDGRFTMVYVTVKKTGRPSRWTYQGIASSPATAVTRFEGMTFVRVQNKTVPSESSAA